MWCFAKKACTRTVEWAGALSWWSWSTRSVIVNVTVTQYVVHKLSQRRLTADWLAPRESDCSRMHSKVSSDWLPSYCKATRPVLEIFKMAGYFPDSPRIATTLSARLTNCLNKLCTCLPDWFTDQMIDSLSTQVNKLVDLLCSSSSCARWVVKEKSSLKTVHSFMNASVFEVRTAGCIEITVFRDVMAPLIW